VKIGCSFYYTVFTKNTPWSLTSYRYCKRYNQASRVTVRPPAHAIPQFRLRSTPVQLVPGIGLLFFRQVRSYTVNVRHCQSLIVVNLTLFTNEMICTSRLWPEYKEISLPVSQVVTHSREPTNILVHGACSVGGSLVNPLTPHCCHKGSLQL